MYTVILDAENDDVLGFDYLGDIPTTQAKRKITFNLRKYGYVPHPKIDSWMRRLTSPHWILRNTPYRNYVNVGTKKRIVAHVIKKAKHIDNPREQQGLQEIVDKNQNKIRF